MKLRFQLAFVRYVMYQHRVTPVPENVSYVCAKYYSNKNNSMLNTLSSLNI